MSRHINHPLRKKLVAAEIRAKRKLHADIEANRTKPKAHHTCPCICHDGFGGEHPNKKCICKRPANYSPRSAT